MGQAGRDSEGSIQEEVKRALGAAEDRMLLIKMYTSRLNTLSSDCRMRDL